MAFIHHIRQRYGRTALALNHLDQQLRNQVVLAGPFVGMRYVAEAIHSAYRPKLLGCYEKELNPIITHICQRQYDYLLNVGAAEGYYAVGLALCSPKTRVIAFEQEATGRHLIQALAQQNGVAERVHIQAQCTLNALRDSIAPHGQTCLIMDVEGAERELLDPQQVPALRQIDILVEVHEFLDAGLADTLEQRFRASHALTWVSACERGLTDLPFTLSRWRKLLLKPAYVRALSEERPAAMRWAWLQSQTLLQAQF